MKCYLKRPGKDVPTGIFILAAIIFIRAFLALFSVVLGIFVFIGMFIFEGFQGVEPVDIILFLSSFLLLLVFISLSILCGSWLVTLQPRGWILVTIVVSYLLLLELIELYQSASPDAFDAVIYIILLLYLNKKSTRRPFGL